MPGMGYEFEAGHLLNDNLGGPAAGANLFPAAAAGNAAHVEVENNAAKGGGLLEMVSAPMSFASTAKGAADTSFDAQIAAALGMFGD